MSTALANIEAEAALLGKILVDNTAMDKALDRLTADDFADPFHKIIFADALTLIASGKPVSPVSLVPNYKDIDAFNPWGGASYLAKLTGSTTHIGLDTWATAGEIAALARRRRMVDGLNAAQQLANDPASKDDEVVSLADAALSEAFKQSDGIEQLDAGDALRSMLHSYDEPKNGVTCRQVPTIDKLLGPIRPKQLVVLAARPGMGKTAVALSYSIGAARSGFNVLFVSLEMSAAQLMQRAASDVLFDSDNPIPYSAIRDGNFDSDHAKRRVWETTRIFDTLPLSIIDAGALTVGRLNMIVQRHKRKLEARGESLDLVVVDYLQLLHPDRRGMSRYEQVTEVSMMLKSMAKVQGIGVLALAQLSREVEKRPDKRPQLSDLRDSGQIEQDADSIMFLYREAYYLQAALPSETDVNFDTMKAALAAVRDDIDIIIAKRRDGETGSDKAMFNGFYQAVRG